MTWIAHPLVLSLSGDIMPLLGYVLIGIGCFVVASVVVILVAMAALCRWRYIHNEMMNNVKVRGYRGWSVRVKCEGGM